MNMASYTTYAMAASTGRVRSEEVERPDARAVDVVFSWGERGEQQVLGVAHLAMGEELTIGETEEARFFVPSEVLGADSITVLRRWGANSVVTVPAGARLRVDGAPRSEASVVLAEGRVVDVGIGAFAL